MVTLERDRPLDLVAGFVGSEGTLGIVTAAVIRLLPLPERVTTMLAAFATTDEAGEVVSQTIAAGIVPAAIEMMDTVAIEAVEEAIHAGLPVGAGAVLLVELDGPSEEVELLERQVEAICREHGATEIRIAADQAERAALWYGRKAAFAAMGRVSPDYYVQDGVVPRTALPGTLHRIDELSREYGLKVANVFHAGDGNLHPLVLYDAAVQGQSGQAEELATRILEACIDAGGSLTGEHGVGVDKACQMPRMYSDTDMAVMLRLRSAFDPAGMCNPGKAFPTPRLCGEVPGPHRAHPIERQGVPRL